MIETTTKTYSITVDSGDEGFLHFSSVIPKWKEILSESVGPFIVHHFKNVSSGCSGKRWIIITSRRTLKKCKQTCKSLFTSGKNSCGNIWIFIEIPKCIHKFVYKSGTQSIQSLRTIQGYKTNTIVCALLFHLDVSIAWKKKQKKQHSEARKQQVFENIKNKQTNKNK